MSEPVRAVLTLRDAYRFFAPLILMTELNMISKSAIHAFLARTETPGPTLAAFNTAFTFYYAMTSVTEVIAPLSLSWLKHREDLLHLLGFLALVMSLPCAVVALTVFTPVGDWFYGEVFGLGKRATAEARLAAGILLLSAPVLLARGVAFALLMRARLTLLITWSTMVRLASLALSLSVWPAVLDGAPIGTAALVTCMAVETAFAWSFAARHLRALPSRATQRPRYWHLWQFSWPLALNQSAELGVVFTINVFLGRLPAAELALAAFGVAHGLIGVLLGPLRSLAHSAQTLITRQEDIRVMVVFSAQVVAMGMGACVVLFNTSASRWVLDTLMGLDAPLAAVCGPALGYAVLMCGVWAFAALFRGMLASARTTGTLAVTGGLRIAVAAAVGATAVLSAGADDPVRGAAHGATLGIVAWIASYGVEALITGTRLNKLGWYAPPKDAD